jgi:hypothetical protein
MEAWNYIAELRNRLLALIHYRNGLVGFVGIANVAKVVDNALNPLPISKPSAGLPIDFPQIDVTYGGGEDDAFNAVETIDEPLFFDAGEPKPVKRDFSIVIIHEARQYDKNAQVDLEVCEAIKAGGRMLSMPADPIATALVYVVKWGPMRFDVRPRNVKKKVRMQTRITLTVEMQIEVGEFNF